MNLGKIRNRGIELLISGTPIRTKDFSWELTWNFTKNWSKVISLPEELVALQRFMVSMEVPVCTL